MDRIEIMTSRLTMSNLRPADVAELSVVLGQSIARMMPWDRPPSKPGYAQVARS